MSSARTRLKQIWFGLRGADPEAVVVTFATGEDAAVEAVAREVLDLIPGRRHYLVSVGGTPAVAGMERVIVDDASAGEVWLQLRRAFRGLRIGMAPVLFTPDRRHAALRAAAFLLAPGKVLAYNKALERHHLELRTAVASFLFWRGVPLDQVWLRPWWLWPRRWRRERSVAPDTFQVLEGRPLSPARARVGVLAPYFPYPLSHGGAVRLFHLLREASLANDIFLFSFIENEKPEDFDPVRAFCARLTLAPKPRYREPRWSSVAPPEVHEYRSPRMSRLIEETRRQFGLRLVQVEYTHLAEYGGEILVEHDITFDLYRQVWERERTVAAWWDWKRWQWFERRWLRRAPHVAVMSEKDAALAGRADAKVIPNGVDLERFTPAPEPAGERLLFIGSFRHFPNVVAFRFFTEQVWPLVKERHPSAELTVVAGPEAAVHWRVVTGLRELPRIDGVRLLGFVADVKPLYEECTVVVVPTLVSAGTNIKVLEAMAMERAVVSTRSGCAGLGLQHGESVWIADGAGAFAEGVARLLGEEELRRQLAAAARRYAESHYSWIRLGALQRALWAEVAPPPVRIRAASAADLEAVAAIEAASPEAARWDAASYMQNHLLVAELASAVVGFLAMRETAGEREILNLAVAPAWRRQGIGGQLVAAAIERAAGAVFLEVRESNNVARVLYRRLGFGECGIRPGYYENPAEAAIVMKTRSC